MSKVRLPRGLCASIGDVLITLGSHNSLNALFISSGAPGAPPDISHSTKWKEWLFRVGQDPNVDSLEVLGNILEELMDAPPLDSDSVETWQQKREFIISRLEENGFQYFRGGRIIPVGGGNSHPRMPAPSNGPAIRPSEIEEVLDVIIRGLPRAIHPLAQRRRGAISLTFESEYDIQDLLHTLLRPWVQDIRPEEFTPSYAGSSTRLDFLLPKYELVIETKRIRDRSHAKKVGEELILDIAHYRAHPKCKKLWCVIYDPERLIENSSGLASDLESEHTNSSGTVSVKLLIVS